MHIEERTLDLDKKDNRSGQVKPIILRRGEKNDTQIKINLTSHGEPYTETATAKFCVYLPNRTYIKNSANTTISGSTVTYTVQDDVTSLEGDIRIAYVELSSGNKVITTDNIPISVH